MKVLTLFYLQALIIFISVNVSITKYNNNIIDWSRRVSITNISKTCSRGLALHFNIYIDSFPAFEIIQNLDKQIEFYQDKLMFLANIF